MDNTSRKNETPNSEHRPIETDAKEIIRKHIEDPNHEITDEDIRNVKVGGTDDVPLVGAESASRLHERDEAGLNEDDNRVNESTDDEFAGESDKPITPWDIRND